MVLSRTLLLVSAAAVVSIAALAGSVAAAEASTASQEEGECQSALQVEAPKRQAVAAVETPASCEGPWCKALTKFCSMFDTNDPWKMQKAFEEYSEYATYEEGIKIAVTKDHFYEMYHDKVAQRLSEYLPQGLFGWNFDKTFEVMEKGSDEATIVRSGTITFNLGWWKRGMFWNNVVKALPEGEVFPYSEVAEFDDCEKCPAKMVFKLKNGGLDGETSKGWKVTGVTLIKLEQVEAPTKRAIAVIETPAACEGPWCNALAKFCSMFDTNDPWKMQKAFDEYSEYATYEEGIKIAVTKDHFYEMYHDKVAQRLSEYLPQGLFGWKFDKTFEVMEKGVDEATVVRSGTITFNLGWWKRGMFWNNVVKALPEGEVFPYSEVAEFDDCEECPAKMVFKLKNGGLDGETSKGWKVTGVTLIKLE